MNKKISFLKILSVCFIICGFAVFAFGAKALTAQEKLEKGQKLYEAGQYDQAMDSFLDVFVEGNIEQINTANEYVNMIHFQRGGVSTPTRVIYDQNLENQKEAYKQEAKAIQKEIEQGIDDTNAYTKEQIDLAQAQVAAAQEKAASLQEEASSVKDQGKQALTQSEQDLIALKEQQRAALLEEAQRLDAQMQQANGDFEERAALAQAQAKAKVQAEQEALLKQEEAAKVAAAQAQAQTQAALTEPVYQAQVAAASYQADVAPSKNEEVVVNVVEEKEEIIEDTDAIVPEEKIYDLETRENNIEAYISSMQNNLAAKLNKREGINVYYRKGKIDAIDIDSDVLFHDDKITFTQEGKDVLEDVYNLMLLSKEPTFVLLPPGAYTDDVDLQGVRQAVALNSYLINKGLSPAKLSFNMGLVNEQPPAKFSNLEGVSIVFDYDSKPNLYNKVSDKKSTPILSLGMYPEKITPALNEGMVIDFSVIETSAPIAEWKLQIIQHASDGKYYIVRQVSGNKSVYEQIFWNGRKQFFGAALPAGKYTLMLRAKDTQGREKVLRRKVEIIGEEKKEQQTKQEQVSKTAKTSVNKGSVLDYTTPRLWTKPAKFLKKASAVKEETIEINEQINIGEASSSSSTQTTTTTTTTTTTKTSGVVNPSATPGQEGLAYDPSLEELL